MTAPAATVAARHNVLMFNIVSSFGFTQPGRSHPASLVLHYDEPAVVSVRVYSIKISDLTYFLADRTPLVSSAQ
jgi:hypothetical protein